MDKKTYKVCIIGLGYVGLPLGIEFAKHFNTVGFDIDQKRINELRNFDDKTLEVEQSILRNTNLFLTHNQEDIKACNIYIITIPTPVDQYNNPNLTYIQDVSKLVSAYLNKGDIVVYESTVYPGVTEDICVPILESGSNLKFNIDFFCGYSPERINPGDKLNTLTTIKKITSGSNSEAADLVDALYSTVIEAGTFRASSIRVAEAAKVIENAQRDINIAFVNELAKIFNLLDIDTNEVLEAASTKWNFLNFKPGLVGGHCIGVDPFYLAHKAKEVGYHPEIILAGRRVNDSMGVYVASQLIKLLIKNDIKVRGCKILVLGITFKENCPDVRNSRVFDILNELNSYGVTCDIYDPWINKDDIEKRWKLIEKPEDIDIYSGVLVAVAHQVFKDLIIPESMLCYDVKGIFKSGKNIIRL